MAQCLHEQGVLVKFYIWWHWPFGESHHRPLLAGRPPKRKGMTSCLQDYGMQLPLEHLTRLTCPRSVSETFVDWHVAAGPDFSLGRQPQGAMDG